MPIVSLFFDNSINKWVWQEPIERCNRVRQKEFNSFNEAREFVAKYN